ncbi:MAG: helix-turn-helix transcriptional regulator [Deltaproteobacteria bacterium]|nr:helix-turn-helix transcriptional regulator [Deltaproteobacteria bacterium]MBW2420121.1 helix-turn-helix transcriptional regulator [Deltaproteobacteria bacterium]
MAESTEEAGPRAVEGRRERRKRELRARIYEKSRQLFLEQGFEATTVAQIAEAADIAQATFFNHFQSKHALLVEITTEVSGYLQALVDRQLRRDASALDRVTDFAAEIANELSRASGLAREVMLELSRSSAQPGEAYPYLNGVHAPFAALFREGQEKGEVRSDLDAALLSEIVVGGLNVAVTNWIVDPDYPLEERLRLTAAFLTEAIAPRNARGAASGDGAAEQD